MYGYEDQDSMVNDGNVVYYMNYLFRKAPFSDPTKTEDVDGDGDGIIDLSDVVYLVDYLFKGGPVPTC